MPILPKQTIEIHSKLNCSIQKRIFIENDLSIPVEVESVENLDGSKPQILIKIKNNPKNPH